jgi:tRNA (adenine57-N1/adenine58-N1)-methyltransferase
MPEVESRSHVFREGDQALILDRRGRRYLEKLNSESEFHSHLGNIPHSDVIGRPEGVRLTTNRGHRLLVLKPTMADFTRQMPRIATVVYPKDLGAIIVFGDIFPGARVLEAGTGSGAVTIALLRAVGAKGRVISYDVREDMIERAQSNIESMFVETERLTLKLGDVYQGFEETGLDRIVLDLPEPWQVVRHAAAALVPGGLFLSFLPTVLQFHELTKALRHQGEFDMIETVEVLVRPWSVGGRSVRPDQRMVSHTGFITTARKCESVPANTDGDDN